MNLYNEEDIIKETKNYLFFEYGLFNRKQYRWLNIYQDKMRGRFCRYKDYENPESTRRMHYILPNQNIIILKQN